MDTDYVPRADSEFNPWAVNAVGEWVLNAARWNFNGAVVLVKVLGLLAVWGAAYLRYLEPDHGAATTAAKNAARAALETEIRLIYNTYIRFNPEVTAADRKNMKLPALGVPVVSGLQGEVDCAVSYSLRRIIVQFFPKGITKSRGKPNGVRGVEIHWCILERPPLTIDELIHTAMDTASPYTFTFGEEERGKTLYFCLRWENGDHGTGPWSLIYNAVIP
ncbi:hypothetical protein FACS1894137_15600 [Spirochaetia bacterium]|nr:hypothetical protein FACS1894137_15600 [Spirochaetia bacterium]